jgi:hypothetical protein
MARQPEENYKPSTDNDPVADKDPLADKDLDTSSNDSFPASDAPSHSGITGVRHKPQKDDDDLRPPPHERGQEARPTGQPTWDRHAAETAHGWEDEQQSKT